MFDRNLTFIFSIHLQKKSYKIQMCDGSKGLYSQKTKQEGQFLSRKQS